MGDGVEEKSCKEHLVLKESTLLNHKHRLSEAQDGALYEFYHH